MINTGGGTHEEEGHGDKDCGWNVTDDDLDTE
jgi:hypothetical protein